MVEQRIHRQIHILGAGLSGRHGYTIYDMLYPRIMEIRVERHRLHLIDFAPDKLVLIRSAGVVRSPSCEDMGQTYNICLSVSGNRAALGTEFDTAVRMQL